MFPVTSNTLRKITRPCLGILKKSKYCTAPAEGSGNPKKGLVLGVYQEEGTDITFTPATKKFNEQLGGKLDELIKECGSDIQRGAARVFNNIEQNYWSIAVVGIGASKLGYNHMECIDEGRENVRVAAAIGAKKLAKQGCKCICLDDMGYAEQAAEGSALAVWRFQKNRNKQHRRIVPSLELFEQGGAADGWQRGLFKADSQNLVRELCDMPANQMTPLHFAQVTVNELCPCGIKVEVHDKDWVETKKMHAFLTVARGSCAPPLFMEINYCGAPPDQPPVMLVGKGVTFDSGGLCLKHCKHMGRHRADLAGAAVVVASIKAAAALSLPINIRGMVPLCENMPSGMAMKVGDVVTGLNGKTIRIQSTDNDGRLCLADAIVYGQTAYKPKLVIDVTTETKGVTAALGSAATGVFTNSHTLWKQVRRAGAISGDRPWLLPLWKYYQRNVTGARSVDVLNRGIGKGDPCLAAAFIQEFITCVDWIHMDINGVGLLTHDKSYPYLKRGRMSGRPTRTLIQLLYQLACPPSGAGGGDAK